MRKHDLLLPPGRDTRYISPVAGDIGPFSMIDHITFGVSDYVEVMTQAVPLALA